MFQGFLRLVIHLAEGMFGITNSFTDNFQRFGHSLICFFVQVQPRVKEALGLSLVRAHCALKLASASSSDSIIRPFPGKSIQNISRGVLLGADAPSPPGKRARSAIRFACGWPSTASPALSKAACTCANSVFRMPATTSTPSGRKRARIRSRSATSRLETRLAQTTEYFLRAPARAAWSNPAAESEFWRTRHSDARWRGRCGSPRDRNQAHPPGA